MNSKIISIGSYVPSNTVTNKDLEKTVDTTDEWIVSRTGIKQRPIADSSQATSDLAYEAATIAIERAKIDKNDIDLIIVGTCTPDVATPNVGTLIQKRLGLSNFPAFSIEAACSGFIYALNIADKFIKTGESKCALVVGAETLSRITNWDDRNTCVLFADGAGAAILKPTDDKGIIFSELGANGEYADLLHVPYGTSRKPEKSSKDDYFLRMSGNEVFKVAVKTLEEIAIDALKKSNIQSKDVDWFIPHQANVRIIQAVAKRLELPEEKVILSMDIHGNTSAASIPLAFDRAVQDG